MSQDLSLRKQDWHSIEKIDVHLEEAPKTGRIRVMHQLMRHGVTLPFGLYFVSRTRPNFLDLSQEVGPPSLCLGRISGAHKVQINVY